MMRGCKSGMDKSAAADVLADMGGLDIVGSLDFFGRNGGHCDCEILLNVDRDDLPVGG